jgi:SAM-dependent methyltransferase
MLRGMTSVNANQIAEWNAASGEKWVRHQVRMDALYAEYEKRVIVAAELRPGEAVIDIGTGCGAVALEAGRAVGSGGTVLGVDISAPMLARAETRARDEALPHVRFELVDVQTGALGQSKYDVAVSRFGVMFFDDPVAAFENIRGALRSTGRLAFACWQTTTQNPWVMLVSATLSGLLELPSMDSSEAPGPFAFADPARVRGVLKTSGFSSVEVAPLRVPLWLGQTAEEAAQQLVLLGPASRALSKADESVKQRAADLVREAMVSHVTAHGVVLDSNAWLVTATHGA